MEVFGLSVRLKEEGAAAVASSLKKLGLQIGAIVASVGGIGAAMKKFVDETSAAQAAQAQLAAVLKSTGGIAGQTQEALNAHAAALQSITAYGDDAVTAAQSLLLTFTQIQGDTFPKATEAVLNVASAMGTDLQSAAIQVGKALNDPILGVTALARSGIQFTESQKEMIKSLVEAGNQVEAQRIILKELETQFGGSAVAARDTLGGALTALNNAFGDLFEVSRESSSGIIQAIESITAALPKLRDGLNEVYLTWSAYNAQTTLAIAEMDLRIYKLNTTLSRALQLVTGGLAGTGMLTEALANAARAQTDIAALEVLLAERQKALAEAGQETVVVTQAKTTALAAATTATAQQTTAEQAQTTAIAETNLAITAKIRRLKELRQEQEREFARSTRQAAEAEQARFGVTLGAIPAPSDLGASNVFKPLTEDVRRQIEAAEFGTMVRETLADTIQSGVEDGFAAGIAAAIGTGRIADAFRAMGQAIVQNLASAMVKVALAAMRFGTLMENIRKFMVANPAVAVAAAATMLAFAYANGGKSQAAATGVSGGIGGATFSPMTGGGATGDGTVTRLIFGNTSATTAAGMTPREATNVTIIGPDDPKAQRAIEELITKGRRRGTLG